MVCSHWFTQKKRPLLVAKVGNEQGKIYAIIRIHSKRNRLDIIIHLLLVCSSIMITILSFLLIVILILMATFKDTLANLRTNRLPKTDSEERCCANQMPETLVTCLQSQHFQTLNNPWNRRKELLSALECIQVKQMPVGWCKDCWTACWTPAMKKKSWWGISKTILNSMLSRCWMLMESSMAITDAH